MNLHEYQAKALFADFGLPVSRGIAVDTPGDAVEAATELGGDRWVCKVQVHAGGRGKAGGVRLVDDLDGVRDFATEWLGKRLVTVQTDAEGQPVAKIFVEEAASIERELYLGAVVDRASRRVVVMASTEGGVEIEQVAAETPEKILRAAIDPATGAQPFQGRAMAFALGLEGKQVNQFANVFVNLVRLFQDLDCSLVEVNPLVVTGDGDVHCLDAKMNIDGNALYRQPAVAALRDPTQEDEREAQADQFGLNYVALDGNIGCMVNGAGLAMGTMDLVKLHGGNPANFLDVGGGATEEAVAEAFKIILSDDAVQAVLINIFGGIVSCKIIAEGIIAAVQQVGVEVPVIVRFEGNNAAAGLAALEESGLAIATAASLEDAATKAVAAAGAGP
ncbi:MAG: ADP-forming succinate--CoA ligase subunit beta [Gammaproteobacteria bacterium]|nr:ADP-forming succinate--CoA ligase subunit beta [Gammaproteobacteria bacterium]MXY56783.1 ADP-forming succinate--CoA ligase subunit beta [Gammaproteobacteria bacterium]MYF31597.1 ADP-forming succinate--CoA ligase subunit beta [Gammaproteobacteria bacterium]MYK47116.1 ADP-forming succinate--CoA ligase subunit beta [Gammaproteobacteria bacterium]